MVHFDLELIKRRTMLKGVVLTIIILPLLLTVGCFTQKGVPYNNYTFEINCEMFQEFHDFENDIEVSVGDRIALEFCSNMTTGFEWEQEISGKSVVLTYREFVPPTVDILGAPGKEIWTLEATEIGVTDVIMEYSQSWEGGEKAEWTYNMTIIVE